MNVQNCFSLAAFKILSLTFDILIKMFLSVPECLWIYPIWNSEDFMDSFPRLVNFSSIISWQVTSVLCFLTFIHFFFLIKAHLMFSGFFLMDVIVDGMPKTCQYHKEEDTVST